MAKEALKKKVRERQNGECALSNVLLEEWTALFDTDRITPKAQGGIYTNENTRVVHPVAHMQRHGNLVIRPADLDELKCLVDDRQQILKLRNKFANQLLAYKRQTDSLNPDTVAWLEAQLRGVELKLRERSRAVKKFVKSIDSPLAKAALGVRGVGPMTVAFCLVYIRLEKAKHASSLWKYAGLHCASHERYTKGEASGGNKTLRTALYTLADSQVKSRGPYRKVYDRVKKRLENSCRIVKTRNTQGKLVEKPWCETKPSHRHGTAMRAIMKHFLADWWYVGRTIAGLPTDPVYPVAHLGHERMIMPEERGWVY